MKRLIVIASLALLVSWAAAAQALAGPVLAGPWSTGQKGYGHARPNTIFNGGDPSGLVNHIRWASWGRPHAVGFGIGLYVGPHQATLDGTRERSKIVLFKLGYCHGRRSYNGITWFFPQHHQRFDPGTYVNPCTGAYHIHGRTLP